MVRVTSRSHASLGLLRRSRAAWKHSASAGSHASGWGRGRRRRRAHPRAGRRHPLHDEREFGKGKLALGAGFNFIEAKAQQGLFGISEVEKVDLTGEIAGAGHLQGLALAGEQMVLQ